MGSVLSHSSLALPPNSWLLRGTSNVWDLGIHSGEILFSESTGLINDKNETAYEAMVIRNSWAP